MRESMNLEDLKNMEFVNESEEKNISDKSAYRRYSKDIAITVGFLLGVNEESALKRLDTEEEYRKIIEKIEKDENALAIRHLNNIRSNLIIHFKTVSRSLRNITADYKPLDKMEYFESDFRVLNRLDISIITGRYDLFEYLTNINNEIIKRVDKIEYLFPDWIKFKNIRSLFIMPQNIEEECKKFQANKNAYPFQRYLYWKHPEEMGYILSTDSNILEIAYRNNGEFFEDYSKVTDASDVTKFNISEFIASGRNVQIFIDGENADPYKLASTIYGLADYEIDKISRIVVYYDAVYTSNAWQYLKHFVFDIPVETIPVERISEQKSLVDHSLVVGVSRAVYKENADSIILVSSDSDFWSVIRSIDDAKFMVMVESDKCGYNFKTMLRDNGVFYCYLDKFKTIEDNKFFKVVFRKELEEILKERFQLGNAKELFHDVLNRSRAEISDGEGLNIFDKYIKGLRLIIDSSGNFKLEIPE